MTQEAAQSSLLKLDSQATVLAMPRCASSRSARSSMTRCSAAYLPDTVVLGSSHHKGYGIADMKGVRSTV